MPNACTDQFSKDKWLMWHDRPHIFFQSQWQFEEGPSMFYLLYRWVITLYLIGTSIYSTMEVDCPNQSLLFKIKRLTYLTEWGYLMCIWQSLFCTVCLTAWIIQSKRLEDEDDDYQQSNWINRTYKIYWICNTIATDMAFFITIIYWTFIYDSSTMRLDIRNMFIHAGNSIVMFTELCIVKHPTYFIHSYWTVLFAVTYSLFSFFYYLAGGTSRKGLPYIYPILDWRKGGQTVGVLFGMALFIIVLHCFTSCIYILRTLIYKNTCSSPFSTRSSKYSM